MNINLGSRVVHEMTATRWQIVDYDGQLVTIRRLVYRASMDGRGPMEWCPTEETAKLHRANFEVLYALDTEKR